MGGRLEREGEAGVPHQVLLAAAARPRRAGEAGGAELAQRVPAQRLGKVAARLITMIGAGVVAGLGGDPVAEPLGLAVTVERVA